MNIQNYLPHRYPFLLIDKIIDIKKNESINSILREYNVSKQEVNIVLNNLIKNQITKNVGRNSKKIEYEQMSEPCTNFI